MISVILECARSESDLLVAECYDLGTPGITEEALPEGRCRLTVYFDSQEAATEATLRLRPWALTMEQTPERNWTEASRAVWRPLMIGHRLFLAPPWDETPVPPGRIRIEMPTGLAFGTGLHATTQLAMEAIDVLLKPGASVLDLGMGSGILAVTAALLGADRVVGCDIDPGVLRPAREFADCIAPRVLFFAGSVRSVRGAAFDLVAANINAVTIISLAGEIARVLTPGGHAAVTGLRSRRAASVRDALKAGGLKIARSLEKDDWACLIATRTE